MAVSLICFSAVAADLPLRLRMEWGGGLARQWSGSISLSAGALSQLRPLGVEADSPGSMWLEDGRLEISERSARVYDGVDVTAVAPADARLVVTLSSHEDASTAVPIEIPLADLLVDYQNQPLDELNNRLLVRRAPGDKLQIKLDRKSLVFAPGELLQLEVQPHRLLVDVGTKLTFDLRLLSARDGVSHFSEERELTISGTDAETAVPLEITLPEAEGVYDLLITGRTRPRLGLKQTVAERKVQLIILSSEPLPAAPAAASLTSVVEVDPASPAWWKRLTNIPLIPGLSRGPLGSGAAQRWQHAMGPMIQLGPGGREPDIGWEAYPLPISRPGEPHVLEVDYPSDVPQTLGISILEPNAAGTIAPIGLDSGFYLPDETAGTTPKLLKHRVVFWPRTKTPLVLMTNRREGSRAVYGKIRVLSGDGCLPPVVTGELPASSRLLAACLARPLFPENFGAAEALDDWSHRSLDDWTTFYQGGTRLVEYLRYAGYNGLMVSVLADGSTIYPSTLLEPTPRYDTGVFFATGQDAVQKDVLELLFRLFDRENLPLIPAVQFSAPLPELEALIRQDPAQAKSLRLIGPQGTSWLDEQPPRRGLAPYYNPLHPRVQQAMLKVVDELVERYKEHPSFQGLALQLNADGYAQFPGPDWGCDDLTIESFQHDTSIGIPTSKPEYFGQRTKALQGKHREAWLAWRAKNMTAFYQQVQRRLATVRPGAKLYLAGAEMFNSPQLKSELQPALPRRTPIDQALLSAGIDAEQIAAATGLVLLRPQLLSPSADLKTQAVNLELNQSPELDRAFQATSTSGSLFLHEPQEARLASFDVQSPYKNSYTWLLSQLSPVEEQNRRRFIHSLATSDAQVLFEGGWLLPLGQEASLREFITLYRALPAKPFETFQQPTQPVVIRTLAAGDRTYFYLVNDSPWPATVDLRIAGPSGLRLQSLMPSRTLPALVPADGQSQWRTTLEPYDAAGGWLSSREAVIRAASVTVDESVLEGLELRIQDLQARAAVLKSPTPLNLLVNPSFEEPPVPTGEVAQWTFTALEGASAEPDEHDAHDGAQSIRLASAGPLATLASAAFDAPRTGRLSVSVWLRVKETTKQPPLRLAIEGQLRGKEYYRHAVVGSGANAMPIGTEWAQYVFQVPDLPAEGLSQLRVRFDLMGAGEVSIDEVQLFDLVFTENELIELTAKILALASAKLRQKQVGDCQRILEGYWPRFLETHVALTEVAERPSVDRPTLPTTPMPTEEKKPGFFDRLKSALPERLRF